MSRHLERPDAIDLYERRADIRALETSPGLVRRTRRTESGAAVRLRLPDGRERLEATSVSLHDLPADDPGDPALIARDVLGLGLPLVLVQCAWIGVRLTPRNDAALTHALPLAVATLGVRLGGGLLTRTRIATAIDAETLARDADELRAAARPAPRSLAPGRVRLVAALAASVLGLLWERARAGPTTAPPPPPPPAPSALVSLEDDARPGGGPLGSLFDAEGAPTRRVPVGPDGRPLAGAAFGRLRASFLDPPAAAPVNLAIRAAIRTREARGGEDTARPCDLEALALGETHADAGGGLRLQLFGRDPEGRPAAATVTLDLASFLAGIEAVSGPLAWTPAAGAAGAPDVLLRLR